MKMRIGLGILKRGGAGTDSLLLSFIQIITYMCSMITAKLLSVALTKTEYGTYASVMLVITTTCSLILLGLPDCINYFFNIRAKDSNSNERESYVNTILGICLCVGIGAGVILLIVSDHISYYFKNPAIKGLVVIACLMPCFENAVRLYQTLYVSTGNARVIAVRNFIISLIKVVIVAVSLFFFKSLELVFILNVLLDFLQLIILAGMFGKIKYFVNPFKVDLRKVGEILKYGLPMGVYAITNTLMREVDKLVIARITTIETLALYTNCSKLLPLSLFVSSFATVLIPYITKYVTSHDQDNAKRLFKSYLQIGYLTIWMFSGAIIVSAREIIPFLYSDAYVEGLPIFIIYVLDGVLQFASMHLIVAASGNTTFIMKLSVALLCVNSVLDIGLYYLLDIFNIGMLGPAIATCVVTMVYALIMLGKSKKVVGASINEIVDIKHMVKYILELVLIAFVTALIRKFLIAIEVQRYLCMIICCSVYCAIIFAIHLKDYEKLIHQINRLKLGD